MNESVFAMIDKLHARLNDLAEVLATIPFELNGYDKKLDRIDDQVYLLEVELEKKAQGALPITPITAAQSEAFDVATGAQSTSKDAASSVKVVEREMPEGRSSAVKITPAVDERDEAKSEKGSEDKESEGFLTDSAKETIAGATKTLNSLYKDGKEVVGEFSEALGDIKEVLGKNPFKKRH